MIKKSILIFALLFTGCAERGQSLHVPIETTPSSFTVADEKDNSIPTLVLSNSNNETLKNNLSGGLILLIGILLIL